MRKASIEPSSALRPRVTTLRSRSDGGHGGLAIVRLARLTANVWWPS